MEGWAEMNGTVTNTTGSGSLMTTGTPFVSEYAMHSLSTTYGLPLVNSTTALPASVGPTGSSSVKNQPNTALLTMILMIGTFFIAYFLRQFRNSHYLGRTVRTLENGLHGKRILPVLVCPLMVLGSKSSWRFRCANSHRCHGWCRLLYSRYVHWGWSYQMVVRCQIWLPSFFFGL